MLYLSPNSSDARILTHKQLHTHALVHTHTNVVMHIKTHLWTDSLAHHAVAYVRDCTHDGTHSAAHIHFVFFSDKLYSSILISHIASLSKKIIKHGDTNGRVDLMCIEVRETMI